MLLILCRLLCFDWIILVLSPIGLGVRTGHDGGGPYPHAIGFCPKRDDQTPTRDGRDDVPATTLQRKQGSAQSASDSVVHTQYKSIPALIIICCCQLHIHLLQSAIAGSI